MRHYGTHLEDFGFWPLPKKSDGLSDYIFNQLRVNDTAFICEEPYATSSGRNTLVNSFKWEVRVRIAPPQD